MPNKLTFQATLCNPSRFISRPLARILEVMCEGVPCQVNYLIDEAATVGKGANATISYVHHFFSCHGLEETDVHFVQDKIKTITFYGI